MRALGACVGGSNPSSQIMTILGFSIMSFLLSLLPTDMVCPVAGGCYVREHRGYMEGHRSVDIEASVGTTVVSASTGKVVFSGWHTITYPPAKAVIIEHSKGNMTSYWHLSEIIVKKGEFVVRGQQIGESGQTGMASWPHLHFSVWVNWEKVEPNKYISIIYIPSKG